MSIYLSHQLNIYTQTRIHSFFFRDAELTSHKDGDEVRGGPVLGAEVLLSGLLLLAMVLPLPLRALLHGHRRSRPRQGMPFGRDRKEKKILHS